MTSPGSEKKSDQKIKWLLLLPWLCGSILNWCGAARTSLPVPEELPNVHRGCIGTNGSMKTLGMPSKKGITI